MQRTEDDSPVITGDPYDLDISIDLYPRTNPNLPAPICPSVSQVENDASKMSRNIFEYWDKLRTILEQYEAIIQRRWMKKTHKQRTKVLVEAWGSDIAAMHRPDFKAFRQEPLGQQSFRSTRFRNHHLLPYINLEDLSKSSNLLNFLHSRGYNRPDSFAFFDRRMSHQCQLNGTVQPIQLNDYVMYLRGQTSPETYGKLHSLPKATIMAVIMSGAGATPGEGSLVLEMQEKILKFLLQCAKYIIHDLPLTSPFSASMPSSPPPLVIHSDVDWPSVAASAATAPYRVPAQFDFSRLEALINAKLAEAEDHIWSLREDPSYFQDFSWDWSQHRIENLPTVDGKLDPQLRKPRFWDNIFSKIIALAYKNVLMWNMMGKQLMELMALRNHYGSQISTSTILLPADYQMAAHQFFYLVRHIRDELLHGFSCATFTSLPLRRHYMRQPIQEGNRASFTVTRRDPHRDDYFLWLIERFSYQSQVELYGLAELIDELEYVTRTDTACAERISGWVAGCLSGLAVLSEIGAQLKYHEPPILRHLNDENLEADFRKRTTVADLIWDTCTDIKLSDIGTPLEKFRYPSERKRTAVTTERMQTAEKDLDMFWLTVDEHFKDKTGKTLQELVSDVLPPRTLERTADWIENIDAIKTERPISPDTITDDFSKLHLEKCPADISVPVKIKVKTRGPVADEIVAVDTPVPEISIAPTISVSKRAYKVFSALFYDPMKNPPPGEIPWSELLHALASIGFGVEKQYGSAWLFTPPSAHQRTIIFHEPHPSRSLPIRIMRRYGRRLNRTYFWTSATFLLEQ
jgi:hypothetical protein